MHPGGVHALDADALLDARASIRAALGHSGWPLAVAAADVDSLVSAMEAHALRAQRLHEFLAELPSEMDRVVACLDTVQADVLAA